MNRTDGMGRLHELRQKIDVGHRDRIEFVVKLRRTVAGLRKELMDENRAVHAAWFGPTRAEQAEAARIKEEAAAARAKEVVEAARVKEAAAAIAAEAAAVSLKEAAKNALVKATTKTAPVKATKKPAKKVRGR